MKRSELSDSSFELDLNSPLEDLDLLADSELELNDPIRLGLDDLEDDLFGLSGEDETSRGDRLEETPTVENLFLNLETSEPNTASLAELFGSEASLDFTLDQPEEPLDLSLSDLEDDFFELSSEDETSLSDRPEETLIAELPFSLDLETAEPNTADSTDLFGSETALDFNFDPSEEPLDLNLNALETSAELDMFDESSEDLGLLFAEDPTSDLESTDSLSFSSLEGQKGSEELIADSLAAFSQDGSESDEPSDDLDDLLGLDLTEEETALDFDLLSTNDPSNSLDELLDLSLVEEADPLGFDLLGDDRAEDQPYLTLDLENERVETISSEESEPLELEEFDLLGFDLLGDDRPEDQPGLTLDSENERVETISSEESEPLELEEFDLLGFDLLGDDRPEDQSDLTLNLENERFETIASEESEPSLENLDAIAEQSLFGLDSDELFSESITDSLDEADFDLFSESLETPTPEAELSDPLPSGLDLEASQDVEFDLESFDDLEFPETDPTTEVTDNSTIDFLLGAGLTAASVASLGAAMAAAHQPDESNDEAELDAFLELETSEPENSIGGDSEEFGDLDDLLGDDLLDLSETSDAENFSDLDDLFGEAAVDSSVESENLNPLLDQPSAQFDDDDLDALLSDERSSVVEQDSTFDNFDDLESLLAAAPESLAVTSQTEFSAYSDSDLEFDDLEKMLEDADKTMGGTPSAKGLSTAQSGRRINRAWKRPQ